MTYEEAISELKDRYLGTSGYVDKEQCKKQKIFGNKSATNLMICLTSANSY